VEIITPEKGHLICCDECCDLKDKLMAFNLSDETLFLCTSCLSDALYCFNDFKDS